MVYGIKNQKRKEMYKELLRSKEPIPSFLPMTEEKEEEKKFEKEEGGFSIQKEIMPN